MANKLKRTVLSKYMHGLGFESIPPHEFYRAMFPSGELIEWCPNPKYQDETEWKYNAILLQFTDKTRTVPKRCRLTGNTIYVEKPIVKRHMVFDDLLAIDRVLEQANKTGNFCCMAPISYCGRNRSAKNERFLYVLTIEIDHLITEKVPGKRDKFQKGMRNLLHQWGYNNTPRWTKGLYQPPTAVTCSGSGVHLHWFLKEPYPLFGKTCCLGVSDYAFQWDEFRRKFTKYIWNDAISDGSVEQESHGQAFRLVGSTSKKGHLVEAFWVTGKRYSIEELFDQKGFAIGDYPEPAPREGWYTATKKDFDLTKKKEKIETPKMLAAKALYPEWYQRRIVEKRPPLAPGRWEASENVYNWYKDLIKHNPTVGCRYWRLYTLAQYGAKCGIPYEQVAADCVEIGELFKSVNPDKPFMDWEIQKAALTYFQPNAAESKIDFITRRAQVTIHKNKRNFNKQYDHLQAPVLVNKATGRPMGNTCKTNRELTLQYMRDNGLIMGRPKGSGTKRTQVEEWQLANPGCTKADCARETGIDPKTIRKWWK